MRSINVLTSLLLLFFFLFNEAQGIRLGNGMMQPVELLEKPLEKEIPLVAEGFSKTTLSKNEHSDSGRNSRKLLIATSPSSPTHSTTRNEEANYKKDNPMLKAKDLDNNNNNNNNNSEGSVSENLEAGDEHYPDLIDIAEMDYSPAKRKPPIHN